MTMPLPHLLPGYGWHLREGFAGLDLQHDGQAVVTLEGFDYEAARQAAVKLGAIDPAAPAAAFTSGDDGALDLAAGDFSVTMRWALGRRREQQDAAGFVELPDGRLVAVLCDGVGSDSRGGAAARHMVDGICWGARRIHAAGDGIDLEALLREVADTCPGSTTVVAALLTPTPEGLEVSVASAGDSTALVDGERVNELHNALHEQLRAGHAVPEAQAGQLGRYLTSGVLCGRYRLDPEVSEVHASTATVAASVVLHSDGMDGARLPPAGVGANMLDDLEAVVFQRTMQTGADNCCVLVVTPRDPRLHPRVGDALRGPRGGERRVEEAGPWGARWRDSRGRVHECGVDRWRAWACRAEVSR